MAGVCGIKSGRTDELSCLMEEPEMSRSEINLPDV